MSTRNEESARLFIALLLPKEVKEELFKIEIAIAKQLNYFARKIPEENLHVTISFLGSISASEIDTVKARLSTVSHPGFSLTIDAVEYVDRAHRRGGLIWAKGAASDHVLQLRKLIDVALLANTNDSRTLVPHVTLFRLKKINKALTKKVVAEISFTAQSFLVDSFSLMQSISTANGVKYIEIARFNLC